MKVACYTICKNEAQFVDRFMSCLGEADGVYVTDTGSTDDTVDLLRAEGATVNVIEVKPWRFDVPRNVSLAFVPDDIDICISIDLDEVLSPGWCDEIKKAWTADTHRLRYQYVWNTLPDGREGTSFWYDKCHLRHRFRWVKPVHEVMVFDGGWENQTFCPTFKLYHYPDRSKSRGSYLPLLELACREDPEDDRSSHYLGREYMYYEMYERSIVELLRHLKLPRATWHAERCASMRFLGRNYLEMGNVNEAERWFLRACAEAPETREPWFELGKLLYTKRDHEGTYAAMKRAIAIQERPMTYICDPAAWGGLAWDLAGVCAWHMGLRDEGKALITRGAELELDDPRIQKNLQLVNR